GATRTWSRSAATSSPTPTCQRGSPGACRFTRTTARRSTPAAPAVTRTTRSRLYQWEETHEPNQRSPEQGPGPRSVRPALQPAGLRGGGPVLAAPLRPAQRPHRPGPGGAVRAGEGGPADPEVRAWAGHCRGGLRDPPRAVLRVRVAGQLGRGGHPP